MKIIKRISSLLLAVILAVVMPLGVNTAEAASTPESIVAAALKKMKTYETMSYSLTTTRTIDGYKDVRSGMIISDLSIEHGLCITGRGVSGCWEEYVNGKKIYRRSFTDNSWTKYTDKSYDSKSFKYYTSKNALQYLMAHLKNVKLTKESAASYTITAAPNFSGTDVKSVTLVINKKSKLVSSVKLSYKTFKGTYQGSDENFTVKGQVSTWKDICYGYDALKLPSGMK